MAFVQWKVRSKRDYQPANFNANEADTSIIAVGAGDLVGAAFCNVRVVYGGTTPRLILGDGTDPDGFLPYADTVCTVAGLKPYVSGTGAVRTGAYFAAAPGYLYTAADLVSVGYNIGAGNSDGLGRVDFWIWVAKANPY